MKKLFTLLLVATLLVACNDTKKSNGEAHAAMIEASINGKLAKDAVTKEIGFEISDDGSKIPLYAGDLSVVSLWEAYVKAHNERDLETIAALNAEKDFMAYAPNGEVITGTQAHQEFLATWFTESNPSWTTKYLISNQFTDKDGNLNQWVTSGHEVTLTVAGEEVKINQVHDALIVKGRIQKFYINERVVIEQ